MVYFVYKFIKTKTSEKNMSLFSQKTCLDLNSLKIKHLCNCPLKNIYHLIAYHLDSFINVHYLLSN